MKLILIAAFIVTGVVTYRVVSRRFEQRRAFNQELYGKAQQLIEENAQQLGAALHKDIWTDWEGEMDTSSWDLEVDKFVHQQIFPLLGEYFNDPDGRTKESRLFIDDIKHSVDETARKHMSKQGVLHSEF